MVVPAKAGTHIHWIWFGEDSWLPAVLHNCSLGVWVPAFAGTTPGCGVVAQSLTAAANIQPGPQNRGGRFSANALMPSLISSPRMLSR